MKLRNKKTGEIVDLYNVIHNAYREHNINSLKDLENEWEDYEEPKEFYHIGEDGDIKRYPVVVYNDFVLRRLKAIGNYFETREEAEKAVEKLKALKRLQDKGFRFEWWREANGFLDYNKIAFNHFVYNADDKDQVRQDLDLLFGGEE